MESTEELEEGAVFWADKAAQALAKEFPGTAQVVEDEKTPSGRVHVGALRGVIIHDCLQRACKDAGLGAKYIYGIDDFDSLDKVLPYVPKEFEKHLGEPLSSVPSPVDGFSSYSKCYGTEFIEAFNELGARPEIYWTTEAYKSGKFNNSIKVALDNAAEINRINAAISGAQKPSEYLPFKPVCENCGKISTTLAFGWDGKTVAYKCAGSREAKGCGHEGRVSPFDGRGKLPWKVEWAAKWISFNVTCEYAGKDHFTKTGSHTVSAAICREVFNHKPPFGEGYEFIMVGKEKMSTSSGTGAIAADLVKFGDPALLRFFMAKSRPKTQISFEPSSQNILLLYDEYDRVQRVFFGKEEEKSGTVKAHLSRVYEMSATSEAARQLPLQLPFSLAVTVVQSAKGREITALRAMKHLPENLSEQQAMQVEERLQAARKWLENYAPDEYKLKVLQSIPEGAANALSAQEKELFSQVAGKIGEGADAGGDELQNFIYTSAKERGLAPKRVFAAAYLLLLGKERGPRLGPFLLSLEKSFATKRLRLEG